MDNFAAYNHAPISSGPVNHGNQPPPVATSGNDATVQIPPTFRLACGENLTAVTRVLHRPLWSTMYIGSDGTDSDKLGKGISCFCYGESDEATHTESLHDCLGGQSAGLTDTNMQEANQFLPQQAYLLKSMSYETFGVDFCEPGVGEDDAAASAFGINVSGENLARLNRDLLVTLEFLDATRNDAPLHQMPLEYIPSIYGAPTQMTTGGAAGTTTVTTGNNGHIDWFEAELLRLPILLSQVTDVTEEQYRWNLRLSAPRSGIIKGLTQSVGIRWWFDGLFRDDSIGGMQVLPSNY